jgi:hypothetical protein
LKPLLLPSVISVVPTLALVLGLALFLQMRAGKLQNFSPIVHAIKPANAMPSTAASMANNGMGHHPCENTGIKTAQCPTNSVP